MQRKNQKLKINIIGKFKSEKINEKLSNNRLRNTTVKDINIINDKILNIKIIEKFLNDLEFSLNNLNEKKTFNLLKKFTQ